MVPKAAVFRRLRLLEERHPMGCELGKDYVPKSADDFKRVMQALTKPQEGRYATRRGRRIVDG